MTSGSGGGDGSTSQTIMGMGSIQFSAAGGGAGSGGASNYDALRRERDRYRLALERIAKMRGKELRFEIDGVPRPGCELPASMAFDACADIADEALR